MVIKHEAQSEGVLSPLKLLDGEELDQINCDHKVQKRNT